LVGCFGGGDDDDDDDDNDDDDDDDELFVPFLPRLRRLNAVPMYMTFMIPGIEYSARLVPLLLSLVKKAIGFAYKGNSLL